MGNTAIDDALGLVEGRSIGDMIKKGMGSMFKGQDKTEDQEEMRKMKLRNREMNLQMAHIIFSEIKEYSYLHSGPYLVEAITTAVKCNVPRIAEFLDNRIKPYEGNDIAK